MKSVESLAMRLVGLKLVNVTWPLIGGGVAVNIGGGTNWAFP